MVSQLANKDPLSTCRTIKTLFFFADKLSTDFLGTMILADKNQ
jgi:hypothetical protein